MKDFRCEPWCNGVGLRVVGPRWKRQRPILDFIVSRASGQSAQIFARARSPFDSLVPPQFTQLKISTTTSGALSGPVEGDGLPEASWLANQTLEQVLAASEMIGGVLQHGHKVKLTRLSPAQTEEATDIGFSIYSEGPDAVEEALDTIRQTSPANAVQAGPLAYYGALFDWLDRRSNSIDPGPIRDILRNHIVKHSAVEPGTTVLGVEITERRYHTLYSLSAAVGIDRSRLSRLLRKLDPSRSPSTAQSRRKGR